MVAILNSFVVPALTGNRFDWKTMFEVCIDPEKAREVRLKSEDKDRDVCTMCGDMCALKTHARAFGEDET